MGSAVMKPLTRRRGKIKKNKVAVDPANGNEEENETGNCEPSVNCKVNSTKNLRQPFVGKPCKVDVDNTQSNRKVCCTYVFLNGRTNSYDSDEELGQIQLARKKNVSPSQTKNSQNNGTYLLENPKNLSVPSQAPTCGSVSPSRVTHPNNCKNVTPVSSALNTVSCSEIQSPHKQIDSTEGERGAKKLVKPEDMVLINESDSTEDINPEDQDVSRDARTPSPEYDDLEDLKIINPNPSSTEPRATSSHIASFGQTSATIIAPTASDVGVSISKAEQRAPESKYEQGLEVGYRAFIKLSLSTEYMESQYEGAGEPLSTQMDYSQEMCLSNPDTELQSYETQCEDLDYKEHNDSKRDCMCLSLSKESPRAADSIPLECNENNAIYSTDSFGDMIKESLKFSGSKRSSVTSLNGKKFFPHSDKYSDSLSLNHPHVEEVLAVGEEFVDEIDEDFLQANSLESPHLETGKCLTPIREIHATENATLLSLLADNDVYEERKGSSRNSLRSSKYNEANLGGQSSRPGSSVEAIVRVSSSLCSSKINEANLGGRSSQPGSGVVTTVRVSSSLCSSKDNETNVGVRSSRPGSGVERNVRVSSSLCSSKKHEINLGGRSSRPGSGVERNVRVCSSLCSSKNNEINLGGRSSRPGSGVEAVRVSSSLCSSKINEINLGGRSSRPGSGDEKNVRVSSSLCSSKINEINLGGQNSRPGSGDEKNVRVSSSLCSSKINEINLGGRNSRPGSGDEKNVRVSSSLCSSKINEINLGGRSSRPGSGIEANVRVSSSLCSSKNKEINLGVHTSRPASGVEAKVGVSSSLCSSKINETNIGRHTSRPESEIETPVRFGDSPLAHSSTSKAKPSSRPTSATIELQPHLSSLALSRSRPPSTGKTIVNYQLECSPASNDNLMCKDNIIPSRACSSKESLQSNGAIQTQSISNICKKSQSLSSRASTPRVTPDMTKVSLESNKISSRPPSSKRSTSSSEQNQCRSRPSSCKQSASISNTAHVSARPLLVRSRQSSNASRPPSSLDRRFQTGVEISTEGEELTHSTLVLTRSQTSNKSIGGTAFAGGDDDHLHLPESGLVSSKSLGASPVPVAVISTTELTATSPPNTSGSRGSPSQRKTETPPEACEGISSFDHCCLPAIQAKSNQAIKSCSRSSMSSKTGVCEEQEEPSQENIATPKETVSLSQSSQSLGTDVTTTERSSSQARAKYEERLWHEASLSAALAEQPYCLSPDQIGNIRRQLYEEGLKPAEREGGVAFFIPVTEDGLQPQIDGAVVAERLTKTKKASLNYEERMFLANINRQVQLSKKKEFAVRDIRNVKGATSSSDGSDRTKQTDDVDDFDVSF